ncbi:uncharacterized protein LOC108633007 [Ceratina calcarata]|uniref:Uncharacterized protein LOC108633007 n=1 Tax=Ceratina calcarata TaxID=156304 RepID=A0AAJ7JI53_9HYME|nr:uncharacterized protein LOC108633007 [Ceratina calcarata]
MVDRKSKYNSARDRASSIGVELIGDTSRINQENFATEFLRCAEEFNVYPLPRIVIAEMLVNIGCIEDLNLDMNPNAQENYHLLCTPAGSLKYLSLKLCEITDEGVMKIASELKYHNPPNDPKLIILNLANNHITKDGAGHIGKMLRTNRSLRCLVLLGNRICDEGASLILRELKIITLEHEEIVKIRRKKFVELELLDEWMEQRGSEEIDKTINEEPLKKNAKSRTRQSLTKRSKKFLQETSIKPREDGSFIQGIQAAESMQKIRMILGHENSYPFRTESFPMNGEIMATGNLELQYLDLSYNYLTTSILQELLNCLYYQNYMLLGDTSKGLLFILIEVIDNTPTTGCICL